MKRSTSTLLILLMTSPTVLANTVSATGTSVQSLDNSAGLSLENVGISLSNTFATDVKAPDAAEKNMSNTTAMVIGYKLSRDMKLSLTTIFDKDLKNDREGYIRDPKIGLSKSFGKLNKFFSAAASTSVKIPLSKASRVTTSLQTAISLAGSISYDASEHVTKGLSLSYSPAVITNFHEYRVTTGGSSNTQYTLSNSLSAAYSITDKISASVSGSYYRNFDYTGHTKDYFGIEETLSFALPQNFGLRVGHSTGGSALAVNGRESNVSLFDKDLSSYFLNISFSY
ncbi:hypothetical protein [Halobacteriovorax sp.]|uniref:hypothetical protein n=1 Tax=Halobacteriovorax sp. TaxID=2020862 RepID=UPI003564E5CC